MSFPHFLALFARWTPRSLAARIFALYAIALSLFLGLGMGLFYSYQFTQKLEDAQDMATVVAEITAQAIQESVVIGDYDAVAQTLQRSVQGTAFRHASFIDLQGSKVAREQSPHHVSAPDWLLTQVDQRLFDVNRNISVGGHDYGVLRLKFDVNKVAVDLWNLTKAALQLAAFSLIGGLVGVRLLLGRWLTKLGKLKSVQEQIQAGQIEARLELSGDLPTEIRQTFEAFSRTTDSLRNQFGQRIDALMHALVQQKNALDLTASVAEVDGHGHITAANDLFCSTMGLSREAVLGMPLVGTDAPLGDEVWRGTVRTRNRDGQDLWLSRTVVPVSGNDGRIEKWICIDLDFTAQKAAEEELRKAEARSKELAERHLRALLDTVGEGFVLLDPQGRIVISNERFRQMHPPGHPFVPQADGVPRVVQTTGGRWMRAVEYPSQDGGTVGLYSDITEQVRLEQDLRLAKEQAEAGSRSKSEFLATMSHEIRTPMNGIIGMTSLLMDTTLDNEQRRFADTIRNSAESLLNIINDILDFSKIEAGRLEFEEAPFDLCSLVEGVVDILSPKVRGSAVEMNCLVPSDVGDSYMGDGGRLRQVLLNLVGNAVKFTQKGSISVRVHRQPGEGDTHLLRFEVIDTGIGIAETALPRLFTMFTQADASTSRRFGGTGLGLVICKRIIEMMGGSIGVDSVEGQGSTFWFQVPLAPAPGSAKAAPPSPLAGCRLLVVDDMAVNCEILLRQIQGWGGDVVAVDNAPAALTAIRTAAQQGTPFDLVVLDHHMPGMSGLDLAVVLRADPALAGLRLVLLSSGMAGQNGHDLRTLNFTASLTKPILPRPLLEALTSAMGMSHGGDAARTGEPALAPAQTRAGLKVLVAEDNHINQQVAVGLLAKLGHRADVADHGGEAVARLEKGNYDLILMDMQMPTVDGITATRMIRALPGAKARVPVIAVTANALNGDRERCLEAGMDDYLSKPIDRRKLAALLDKWRQRIDSPAEALAMAAETPVAAGTPEPPVAAGTPEPAMVTEAPTSRQAYAADQLMDPETYEDLVDALGAEDFMELVDKLLAAMPNHLGQLNASVAAGDAAATATTAHAVKGAALNLGLIALGNAAKVLEQAAKEKRDDLAPLLAVLQDAHHQTDAHVRSLPR